MFNSRLARNHSFYDHHEMIIIFFRARFLSSIYDLWRVSEYLVLASLYPRIPPDIDYQTIIVLRWFKHKPEIIISNNIKFCAYGIHRRGITFVDTVSDAVYERLWSFVELSQLYLDICSYLLAGKILFHTSVRSISFPLRNGRFYLYNYIFVILSTELPPV